MDEEIRAVEQRLALHAARAEIISSCPRQTDEGTAPSAWYDTRPDRMEVDCVGPVQDAVFYLDARELLCRHPGIHYLVSVKNCTEGLAPSAK